MSFFLVVVPTLNPHSISQLVTSFQCQTFTSWQVLFIDGGSSSDSLDSLHRVCELDPRFRLVPEQSLPGSIYRAMNQGAKFAAPDQWVMFWGSDDWCASSVSLQSIATLISSSSRLQPQPSLFIFSASFSDRSSHALRSISFSGPPLISSFSACMHLFFGSTPPHQGLVYHSSLFQLRSEFFDTGLQLAADLENFLFLASRPSLVAKKSPTLIALLSPGGASSKSNCLRLAEVSSVYRSYFGLFFLFPLFFRYFRRIWSSLRLKT